MQGSHGHHPPHKQRPILGLAPADLRPGAFLVLAPFSTRLPPTLLARLRVAGPRLGLGQGEIVGAALDRYLREHDC
jgi:hypothetical protein